MRRGQGGVSTSGYSPMISTGVPGFRHRPAALIELPRASPVVEPQRIALEHPNAPVAGRRPRQLVLMKGMTGPVVEVEVPRQVPVAVHGASMALRAPVQREQPAGRRAAVRPGRTGPTGRAHRKRMPRTLAAACVPRSLGRAREPRAAPGVEGSNRARRLSRRRASTIRPGSNSDLRSRRLSFSSRSTCSGLQTQAASLVGNLDKSERHRQRIGVRRRDRQRHYHSE